MLVKTRNMKRNVLFFADTNSATRFKNPYQDLNIENIITPLDGKFKYSPKFKNALVTTTIKLTGSRRKDYLEAEKKSNCIHIPKKTVWHHVWEKNPNGEYTIQLIDYKLHQKTIPHAGGCKMCAIETGKQYRMHRRKSANCKIYINADLACNQNRQIMNYVHLKSYGQYADEREYNDFIIDAVLSDEEKGPWRLALYSGKRILIRPWAIDPFGGIFYVDKKQQLYFVDTDVEIFQRLGIRTDEISRRLR